MESLIQGLADFGVLGIMLGLVIAGVLVPKQMYEQQVKRADVATDATAKTTEALQSVTDTNKQILADNRTLVDANKVLVAKVENIERTLMEVQASLRARINA